MTNSRVYDPTRIPPHLSARDSIRDDLRAHPAEAPRWIDWLKTETPKRKKELAHLYTLPQ